MSRGDPGEHYADTLSYALSLANRPAFDKHQILARDLDSAWSFMILDAEDSEGQAMQFPVTMQGKGVLACHLQSRVVPVTYKNEAQFAAKLAQNTAASPDTVKAIVTVEAMGSDKTVLSFKLDAQLVTRGLKDLYVALWEDMGKDDLLRLVR